MLMQPTSAHTQPTSAKTVTTTMTGPRMRSVGPRRSAAEKHTRNGAKQQASMTTPTPSAPRPSQSGQSVSIHDMDGYDEIPSSLHATVIARMCVTPIPSPTFELARWSGGVAALLTARAMMLTIIERYTGRQTSRTEPVRTLSRCSTLSLNATESATLSSDSIAVTLARTPMPRYRSRWRVKARPATSRSHSGANTRPHRTRVTSSSGLSPLVAPPRSRRKTTSVIQPSSM